MTLSHRERYIAVVVLVVVALTAAYVYVYEPMSNWAANIHKDTDKVSADLSGEQVSRAYFGV